MLRQRPSFAPALSAPARLALPVASLLVWAAVAFTAVTWGLRWAAADASLGPTAASTPSSPPIDTVAVARTLGALPAQAPTAPTLASRFQLQGVMAGAASQGAALISVDGKAAKPFRVGAWVADGWVLQSVQGRRVSLGAALDAPSTLVLELPVKK